jgi:hypothetical protein
MRHVLFNWPAGDNEPLHDRYPDGSNYYHTFDTASGLSEPLVVLGILIAFLNRIEDLAQFLFRKTGLPNRR